MITKVGINPLDFSYLEKNETPIGRYKDGSVYMQNACPTLLSHSMDQNMSIISGKPEFRVKEFVDDAKTCSRENDPEA